MVAANADVRTTVVGKYTFTLTVFQEPIQRGVIATIQVIKARPKARFFTSKVEKYIGYLTVERAEQQFDKLVGEAKDAIAYKEAKRKLQVNIQASDFYKISDIVNTRWGYEQTNVEFYQVIEVRPKSIVVQRICESMIPGEYLSMSSKILPVPDTMDAAGEQPFSLRVKQHGSLSLIKGHIYVAKWDGNPEYISWYA
jgi:hypothetical protein